MVNENKCEVPENVKFVFVTGSDEFARNRIITDLHRKCHNCNLMFEVINFPEENLHPSHHINQLFKLIGSFAGMEFPKKYYYYDASNDEVEIGGYHTFVVVVETVSVYMLHYIPIIQSILHAYHENKKGNPAFPSPFHEDDMEILRKCKLIDNEFADAVFAEDFIIIDTDSTNENLIANHPVIEESSEGDADNRISYYDLDLVEYDRIVEDLESVYFRTSFYRHPVAVLSK